MTSVANVAASDTDGVLDPFTLIDLGVAIEFRGEALLLAAFSTEASSVVGTETPVADGISSAELGAEVFRAARWYTEVLLDIPVAVLIETAIGGGERLAWFSASVLGVAVLSGDHGDFATCVLCASVASRSAVGDGTVDGSILVNAKDLAGVLLPNASATVDVTFSRVGEFGATADTFVVVFVPCAVAVSSAGTFVRVEGAAGVAAVSIEGPFAAVGIFAGGAGVDEGASLEALEVVGVPNTISRRLAEGLILGLVGADVGDASLVDGGPFAIGITSAGDLVGPGALAALAGKSGHVPQANAVRGASIFVSGEASARTARCGA